MYASAPTTHTKIRGKIRICAWCGDSINTGERYGKWISIDGHDRSTVYAHSDCAEEWSSQEATGDMYSDALAHALAKALAKAHAVYAQAHAADPGETK